MHPTIGLFGKAVPTYWLCSLLGLAVCSLAAFIRHKKFTELQEVDITNSAALLFVGAILGARLLYLLTIAPVLIRNAAYLKAHLSEFYQTISNGMVFYGGLFGAVFVLHRYCRRYALNEALMFDYMAPLFPLFHAFGRVGCFLTGCCYGFTSEKYGIAFVHSTSAPNGIPFFPIQLVCAFGNLLISVILFSYERKHHARGKTMVLYFLLYGVGRFIVEFFRGDSVRGHIGVLSVSQWLSLCILAILFFTYWLLPRYKKNPRS